MARKATLTVKGYREFLRATARADKETKAYVRGTLRQVGEVVRVDAARRISPVDTRTATGYKVRVRQRGVAVEQAIRKTTGQHPEFGSLQMRRALIPAQVENADRLEREMEHALDLVAEHFERGA